MTESDLLDALQRWQVPFERVEHAPVFTCEEADALVPPLPGVHTKNLFLRDGKGRRHVLVVVDADTIVDLKGLAPVLGCGKLGMASTQRLQRHLGVEPGAVTLLGLVHAEPGAVEVVIDHAVWDVEQPLHCHPLVNTATLAIPHAGVVRFFTELGVEPVVIDVPRR